MAKLTHTNFATTPYANYIEVCKKLDEHILGDFAKKSVLVNSGAGSLRTPSRSPANTPAAPPS